MTSSQLDPARYQVGWVCPLPVELRAARLVLDETHVETLRRENDPSLYTLGRIGEHNVVISGLPAGQTGTHSAASVAARMRAAFPSIQFGLLVGVGGGVPSEMTDIRLGDVVVSQPNGSHGGVIQYDFGKSTSSGFERTGSLSPPPTILLNAMSSFQAAYPPGMSGLPAHLCASSDNYSLGCSATSPDLLFQPDYEHVELQPTCDSCDMNRLVIRPERQDPLPFVHYGLIASANRVMKNGTERDRISRDLGGVLCFEMEAAGLMNDFPCLVIRGICDYADSHKNKSWQPYAATSAAMYARTFLVAMPTAEIKLSLFEGRSVNLQEPRDIQESSSPSVQWLRSNSALIDVISQLASSNCLANTGYQTSSSRISARKQLKLIHQMTAVKNTLTDNQSTECMCEPFNRTRQWRGLAFFHFKNVFRNSHYSFCPEYKVSEHSLELMMRVIPPKWLLAHTLDLSFKVQNWRTMKGFRITPFVIGTTRLVDAAKSPAFRALRHAKEELEKLFTYGQVSSGRDVILARLQPTLRELIRNGSASVLDEDSAGNTILSTVMDLFHEIVWIEKDLGTMSGTLNELVRFLLDSGSSPNVPSNVGSRSRGYIVHREGGTLLETFSAEMIVDSINSKGEETLSQLLCQQLIANGCEFTQPFHSRINSKFNFIAFPAEVSMFRHFPEQVELCGHNRLVSIILQKSEKDLVSALVRDDVNAVSPVNGLTALHFSIKWPLGLTYLLEAGANVNAEDMHYRTPILLAVALGYPESVNLLLQHDCSLMTPPQAPSVIFTALYQSGRSGSYLPHSDEQDVFRLGVVDAVIDSLIDRYDRLMSLAHAYLSQEEILRLQLHDNRKREKHITLMTKLMKTHGCIIPPSLQLDDENVYNVIDGNKCCMTPTTAEKLWKAGFDQIDDFNADGMTPMLQNWFLGNFRMVSWFISKGVSPSSCHRDGALNGLHLYAAGLTQLGIRPGARTSSDEIASVIAQLTSSEDLYHDDCISTCPCAPSGCTPLSLMVKMDPFGAQLQLRFSTWIETIKPCTTMKERHLYDFTRALLFNQRYCRSHVCCTSILDRLCRRDPTPTESPSAEELAAMQEKIDTEMDAFTRYKHQYDGPVDELPFRFVDDFIWGAWRDVVEIEDDDTETQAWQESANDEELLGQGNETGDMHNDCRNSASNGDKRKISAVDENEHRPKRRKFS